MVYVAPYVGAWIETDIPCRHAHTFASHPMWVRGLKHLFGQQGAALSSRTLCGCVD